MSKKERNDMKNVVKRFEQYLMEEEKAKVQSKIISGLYICL